DISVLAILTLSLFVIGYGFRGRPGRINRFEGGALFASYIGYATYLIISAFSDR
ncbi:MAG: calcium/sodium antiporter, partial [Chitinispirillaceae bacterium]